MSRPYHPRGLLVDGVMVKDHPLYGTWASMKNRCFNQSDIAYPRYGGARNNGV